MRHQHSLYDIVLEKDSGTVALTGAAPQTGAGLDLGVDLLAMEPGTLSAKVSWNIKASGLTYTLQWQVSEDGSTWYQMVNENDAAQVAFATGTGSDVAGGPLGFQAPQGLLGHKHARAVVVTGGSATGVVGHDNCDISYCFRRLPSVGE